ncbi:MAG: cytochrome c oxidase subunit [Acidobacteriaceae bacterium]|jgi:cytochrome c oxidase subunit 2|nr:cytochrome c oxidase subunit [Acidobacteriaceae bacterium]
MQWALLLRNVWMPPNAAAHGIAVDRLMRWDVAAMVGCFVLAQVLLVWLLWRPRRHGTAPSSWRVELIPLALLTLLYIAMAVTAEHVWASQRFEGPAASAMRVEVVGQQFQWYFHYPGSDAAYGLSRPALVSAALANPLGLDPADPHGRDDIVASELVLPADREVDLQLRALDVIHGFFIPQMRLKQNAVPGEVLHVHFTPIAIGTYPILCSQLCGSGHARMQARLRVIPPRDYDAWLAAHAPHHEAAQ